MSFGKLNTVTTPLFGSVTNRISFNAACASFMVMPTSTASRMLNACVWNRAVPENVQPPTTPSSQGFMFAPYLLPRPTGMSYDQSAWIACGTPVDSRYSSGRWKSSRLPVTFRCQV